MPGYRAQLFFQNGSGYGWSENYWNNAASSETAALQLAYALGRTRLGMCTVDVTLPWVRISSPGNRRAVRIYEFSQAGGQSGRINQPANPDFTALLVRLTTNEDNVWSHLFLRGIPQNAAVGDIYVPTAPFNTAFRQWLSLMTNANNGWSVRSVAVSPPPPQTITAIVAGSPRGMQLTLQTPAPYTRGNQVRISGVGRSMIGANGYKQVEVTTSGSAVYLGGASPSGTFTGTATITPLTAQLYQVTDIDIKRPTHRPGGRFFGLRRGRRSTTLPLRQ